MDHIHYCLCVSEKLVKLFNCGHYKKKKMPLKKGRLKKKKKEIDKRNRGDRERIPNNN